MTEQELWMVVRRGLLLVVSAIEKRFGLERRCPKCESGLDKDT